jgi:hypothetical protein
MLRNLFVKGGILPAHENTGAIVKFTESSLFKRSLHDNLSGAHQKPAARHHLGLVKSAVQNKQIRV